MSSLTKSAGGQAPDAEPEAPAATGAAKGAGWKQKLSFANIGAVYVWLAIIVLFSFWADDFFEWNTATTVLNQNAISGIIALALVVPLSARVFDLSVGNAMGLCSVIVAWLLVEQGVPIVPAILLTIAAGIVIGTINATIVVGGRIDSFIGTLATGALMAAATVWISEEEAITGEELGGNFGDIATKEIFDIALPVYLMLIVALILWFTQSYTVTGRRIYATGFNEDGARLAGIRTGRLKFSSLIVSGMVAGIAGILLTSQVSSGSPDAGPPYLLDAFAAAFLGATQFGGRFNAWGTVIAVLLLGTGTTGLVYVDAPVWAPDMFTGAVLLFALGLGNLERTLEARSFIAERKKRRRSTDTTGGRTPGTEKPGSGNPPRSTD